MSIRQGSNLIAGSGSGVSNIDNLSITENANEEIQTVGVINSRDSSTAIKTWTGTKAQYDAIVTKDANTLYNITDDTDVSLTILEALYPVGSVYITTANTCPLSMLISGSTWTLVSSGIVIGTEAKVKTTSTEIDTTNMSVLRFKKGDNTSFGTSVIGINSSGSTVRYDGTLGTNQTDIVPSNLIADLSNNQLSVNIYRRTA